MCNSEEKGVKYLLLAIPEDGSLDGHESTDEEVPSTEIMGSWVFIEAESMGGIGWEDDGDSKEPSLGGKEVTEEISADGMLSCTSADCVPAIEAESLRLEDVGSELGCDRSGLSSSSFFESRQRDRQISGASINNQQNEVESRSTINSQ
jgi:hypothetical protein